MKLYSAIDLHSTNSYIAVLNEDLSANGSCPTTSMRFSRSSNRTGANSRELRWSLLLTGIGWSTA
jgi:hypothetical protein